MCRLRESNGADSVLVYGIRFGEIPPSLAREKRLPSGRVGVLGDARLCAPKQVIQVTRCKDS